MLQITIVTISGFAIVTISQFVERYLHKHYFSVSQILVGIPSGAKRLGVPLRLALPTFVGAVIGLTPAPDPLLVAGIATGFGAFLLVWPVLLRPEYLPPELTDRWYELRLLYLAFIGLYAALGLFGAALAPAVFSIFRLIGFLLTAAVPVLTFERMIAEVLSDLIAMGIGGVLTLLLRHIFNVLLQRTSLE